MDIKLVPYADKVTGSNAPAGKVSADDLNQIKKILNAIVQALFTLDGSGVATSAIVKLAALPDVELLDYFNNATVVAGKLTIGNGGSLPAGTAPTNFVVDDTANTASFTPAAGTTATAYEYSVNGGTSYVNVTVNPIAIGNVALAIGAVKIRAKATSSNSASAAISNTTAYTVAGGGNGLSNLTDWTLDTTNPAVTGSNTYFHGSPNVNSYNQGFGLAGKKLAAGAVGVIQMQCPHSTVTDSGGQVKNSTGTIGFYTDNVLYTGPSDSVLAARREDNGYVAWQYSGGGSNGAGPGALADNGFIRLRADGTTVHLETSPDGATWTERTNRPQPNADLYVHFNIIGQLGYNQQSVSNIQFSGLV